MLKMGPACKYRELHVCNDRSGQYSLMHPFLKMSEYQPLPVPVKDILTAYGIICDPRPPWHGTYKDMGFRVMPQGLVVAHSLDGLSNGLLINDCPGVKGNAYMKPVQDGAL